jgi:hypothetical protein
MALPQFPVKVASKLWEGEVLAEVRKDDIALSIFLLWVPGHLVSDNFTSEVLSVAKRIKEADCSTYDEFRTAFLAGSFPFSTNFLPFDVDNMLEDMLPYLTGQTKVPYEVVENPK